MPRLRSGMFIRQFNTRYYPLVARRTPHLDSARRGTQSLLVGAGLSGIFFNLALQIWIFHHFDSRLDVITDILNGQTRDLAKLTAKTDNIQKTVGCVEKQAGSLEGTVGHIKTTVDRLKWTVDRLK
ncbi:hypothetical protein TWF696_001516 [Orbilia brochopaga]|uniref:Uncharacterized protein n=1 Tax=Orbilia brochopaga TaxID=3140254 RepID=A0AAV9U8W6_9PEZI